MNKIYQKNIQRTKNTTTGRFSGFTLIELLVVVLIIGILASIAWPMYQTAVMKAKLTNYIQLASAFKQAEERYYMANGTYTDNTTLLDINIPNMTGTGYIVFDDGWCIDVMEWGVDTPYIVIKIAELNYRIYLDNIDPSSKYAAYKGKHQCNPNLSSNIGKRVCKSMGF